MVMHSMPVKPVPSLPASFRATRSLLLSLALAVAMVPVTSPSHAQQKAATVDEGSGAVLRPSELHRLFEKLRASDSRSMYGEPVSMEASESDGRISGTVLAEIPHPYERVRPLITRVSSLCEVMFMHVNVKACSLEPGTSAGPGGYAASGTQLKMGFGKRDETASDVDNWVHFRVSDTAASADEAHIVLHAAEGPMSTTDFRIVAQALAVGPQLTLLRFHYDYRTSRMAKAAMATYLATAGRNKVGFTKTGTDADGRPVYTDGVRAATERNMMRYYIAFATAAAEKEAANPANRPARLRNWFDHTERHARQLHELDWAAYSRQKEPGPQTTPATAGG